MPSLKDKEWLGVLNGFVKGTTDVDLSELNTYAKPVFNATEGVMRTLKGLIMEAAMIAIDANVTKVEKEHLRLAFRRLVGTGSSKCNPFA